LYIWDAGVVAGTDVLNVIGFSDDDALIVELIVCISELTSKPEGNWSTLLIGVLPAIVAPLAIKVRRELSFRYGALTIAVPVNGKFNCLFSIVTIGFGSVS
jgi:hypothetical protein